MNQKYPLTTLSSFLKKVERFEDVDPLKEYHFAGTYSFARGIFAGERKPGSDFRLPKVQRIHMGDFVYCKIMAWEGAFGLVPKEAHNCVMSGAFVAYEVDRNQIDPYYLAYYFKVPSVWKLVGGQSTGTNVRRRSLHPIQFESAKIPLPPLEEQRRIVARIEELAPKIGEASELRNHSIDNTSHLFEAAMRIFFDFKGSKRKVGDFASVVGGYAFPSEQYTQNGSHQIVRIGNVRNGYLDLSRAPVRWNLENNDRIAKYELIKGDILISMTGTRNKRDYGYIAIVPEGQKLLLNQRVGKFSLHETIDRYYLAYFLRSPFFRDHLFPNATGTANQANIGNKHIEDIPFDPPSSLEVQHNIVTYLNDLQARIDILKQLQTQTQAELDALLPSILDKTFKGEL